MKKNMLVLFTCMLCCRAFAQKGSEKIFVPGIGAAGAFMASQTYNNEAWFLNQAGAGPTLNFDMLFIMKSSGFTIMFNNMAFPIFIKEYDDPYAPKPRPRSMGFGVLYYMELLFGYTHKVGSNLEISAGLGPAMLWPIYPALGLKLGVSYFFSRRYGMYFGFGTCLGVGNGAMYGGRNSWAIANLTSFMLGAAFRLD